MRFEVKSSKDLVASTEIVHKLRVDLGQIIGWGKFKMLIKK